MGKKLTNEQVKSILIERYGDRFDYSKVNYVNQNEKINLICKKHGEISGYFSNTREQEFFCKKCYHDYKGQSQTDTALLRNENVVVKEGVAFLPLTKGYVTKIDIEDLDRVSKYPWRTHLIRNSNLIYACSNKVGFLHRFITSTNQSEYKVDHKDGDGLNNCKNNLRVCTHQENMYNSKSSKNSTSKYKGVCLKKGGKYEANITHNRCLIYLGRFETEYYAAKAYDEKAIELFGEFAYLNFPKQEVIYG